MEEAVAASLYSGDGYFPIDQRAFEILKLSGEGLPRLFRVVVHFRGDPTVCHLIQLLQSRHE
jgi:hypothetical protein